MAASRSPPPGLASPRPAGYRRPPGKPLYPAGLSYGSGAPQPAAATPAGRGDGARSLLRLGTFIGWCSLNRWNPDHRSASLGYCFDEAAWGHGFATEAARVLLRWAFGTLDLNRIQAQTDTRNVASARVLGGRLA